MALGQISPQQLGEKLKQNSTIDLIDVRTAAEYESVHLPAAKNLPLHELSLEKLRGLRNSSNGEPVYFICKSGGRSLQACQKMQAAGIDNVVNVQGGTEGCVQAGLENVRGKWALPLDRQVQSGAGLICLLGMALGTWVNPWWYLLAAMVGFGLFVAGTTGFCPMGVLLAKMPWNAGSSCATGCCCAPKE